MKNIFYCGAVALALLSSCNQDQISLDAEPAKVEVWGSVQNVNTRMTDTTWESGDAIGVTVTEENNASINVHYITNGNSKFEAVTNDIYLIGSDETTFTAYYPFTGEEGIAAGVIEFDVTKAEKESDIDFLFATATASRTLPQVQFSFKHMMSKLYFTFSGVEAGKTINYTLEGMVVDGTFNTATGEIVLGTTKSSIINSTTTGSSSVILPSQSTEKVILKLEIDEKIYLASFTLNLEENKSHNYSVVINTTVDTENVTIEENGIVNWGDGASGSIDTEEIIPETEPGISADGWGEGNEGAEQLTGE